MIKYYISKIIVNELEEVETEKCIEFTEEEFIKVIYTCIRKYCGRYAVPVDYKLADEVSKKLKELL